MKILTDVNINPWRVIFFSILSINFLCSVSMAAPMRSDQPLDIKVAIQVAQENDPWLVGNIHLQNSIEALSVAAGTLPDPKINVGLANLPIDTFDFDQEAMTQFKVGVSQMFPRGKSLEIKKKQLEIIGQRFPSQRENRLAEVAVTVSQLWLDAYKAQESIALIEKDRPLFEQLADVAEASYSSAIGRTRQQDIVRAQLEITRLDDRLTVLKQKEEVAKEKLSQWLSDQFMVGSEETYNAVNFSMLNLPQELPDIQMLKTNLYMSNKENNPQLLYDYFSQHPSVLIIDNKIEATQMGVELAKQKYKPEWGVNASYGYRDDDQSGNDRADFFSVGLSLDVPLFTGNRQDKQVESAESKAKSITTEKWLMIRKMIADFEKSRVQFIRQNQRKKLYFERLIPQMHEQAEASLTAYTNDDGDFAEVVRSRISELNAAIDALGIDVEIQKTIARMNYYFMESADEIVSKKNDQEIKDE